MKKNNTNNDNSNNNHEGLLSNPSSPGGDTVVVNVGNGGGTGGPLKWYSNVESLETFGDILFGIAAIVDECLQDATADDGILWIPIVSACLWTLDALLYLRGDFVLVCTC